MKAVDLYQHLNQLIRQFDHVVIPGFGGFISQYSNSYLHPVEQTYKPPGKKIAFSRQLTQNDGLFVQHLSTNGQITIDEATNLIHEFAENLNSSLENNQILVFKNIGKVFLDIEKNVQFVEDTTANHLDRSFGLPEIKVQPILRKQIVDTKAAIPPLDIPKENNVKVISIKRWASASVASILLLLLAGSYFLIPDINRTTNEFFGWGFDSVEITELNNNIREFSKGIMPLTIPTIVVTEKEEFIETPDFDFIEVPYRLEANHGIPSGYFAVVGAFSIERNAIRLAEKMENQSYEVFLFPPSSQGLVRVGVFLNGGNASEVMQQLTQIRSDTQPNAWLVKNR